MFAFVNDCIILIPLMGTLFSRENGLWGLWSWIENARMNQLVSKLIKWMSSWIDDGIVTNTHVPSPVFQALTSFNNLTDCLASQWFNVSIPPAWVKCLHFSQEILLTTHCCMHTLALLANAIRFRGIYLVWSNPVESCMSAIHGFYNKTIKGR